MAGEGGSDDGSLTAAFESSPAGRLQALGEFLVGTYAGVVILAVVVGLLVAPVAASVALSGSTGTVAVVPVEGGIDGGTAVALTTTLDRLRAAPDVDAVVLVLNSPGGSAPASEAMYLETDKTAEEMPVVTSVDAIAASGAYYTAVGTERIFVKPSSVIGSVGVVFPPPAQVEPSDSLITTGPNKRSGGSERAWKYKTESIKRAFVSAVMRGRGDALDLSQAEVASAEVFTGVQAVEHGVADELGGTRDAVEYAASRAGLSRYDVRVVRPESSVQFLTRSAYLASDAPERELVSGRYFVGQQGGFPNVLMLPPSVLRASLADTADGAGDAGNVPGNATDATTPRNVTAGGATATATAGGGGS
jgi:protease-4